MAKGKRRRPQGKKPLPPDPYFQENPWDIIYDNRGRVIGVLDKPRRQERQGREMTDKKQQRSELIAFRAVVEPGKKYTPGFGIEFPDGERGIIKRIVSVEYGRDGRVYIMGQHKPVGR